jgi:hypothetical protein
VLASEQSPTSAWRAGQDARTERTDATAPAMLSGLLRWRHRGTFLAVWEDVARIDTQSIALGAGCRRYSARLAGHH